MKDFSTEYKPFPDEPFKGFEKEPIQIKIMGNKITMRETGYYWVKKYNRWEVAEWNDYSGDPTEGKVWYMNGHPSSHYYDKDMQEINETRIKDPDENPITIQLSKDQLNILSEALSGYTDCGPPNEGWASAKLENLRETIQNQIK